MFEAEEKSLLKCFTAFPWVSWRFDRRSVLAGAPFPSFPTFDDIKAYPVVETFVLALRAGSPKESIGSRDLSAPPLYRDPVEGLESSGGYP